MKWFRNLWNILPCSRKVLCWVNFALSLHSLVCISFVLIFANNFWIYCLLNHYFLFSLPFLSPTFLWFCFILLNVLVDASSLTVLLIGEHSRLVCKVLPGTSSKGNAGPSAVPPQPCCWLCPGSWSASGSCSVFARTSLWISGLSWPGLLFGCLLCTNRTYIQSCWGLGRNGQVFGSELSQEQGTHSHLPSPSVRPSNSGRGQRWGARLFLFPGDALCDGGPSSTPCPVSVAHRTQNCPGAQVWVL